MHSHKRGAPGRCAVPWENNGFAGDAWCDWPLRTHICGHLIICQILSTGDEALTEV